MNIRSLIPSLAAAVALAALSGPTMGAEVATGVAARAADKGSVRVIVEFAAPTTASALSPHAAGPADDANTAALRAVQSAILSATFDKAVPANDADPHAVSLMDVVPMFAATVDAAELAKLAADPRVTRISEDRLDAPSLIQSTGVVKMTGTSGAWAKGATGTGRLVAVLDTGVNKNHEFLKFNTSTTKVVSEACYNTKDASTGSMSRCPGGATSSTASGSAADCGASIEGCGHGTHVSGIAAGKNTSQSSGEPSKGIAYNAGLVVIDVFSRFNHNNAAKLCGSSATQDCLLSWSSDQIKGLERIYALRGGVGTSPKRKIDAVNMSLGGGQYFSACDTDSRKAIIDKLRAAGIAVVIAAGNSYFTDSVGAPGCISSATTVGATTKTTGGSPEEVASYSNVGPQVDVFAPGGDFGYPSSLGDASLILSSHFGSYDYLAGTSMAAPHVAGAFAAIRSKSGCGSKTVSQIESAMKSTGLAIKDTRSGGTITRKRIDVAKVVTALCP